RRVETGMLDNQLRTMKRTLKVDDSPGGKQEDINNDEGIAIWLRSTPYEDMRNYFRYEGNIERNYYRALHELRDAQAARRKDEGKGTREASACGPEFSQDMVLPDEDVQQLVAARPKLKPAYTPKPPKPPQTQQPTPINTPVTQVSDSGNGFVRQPHPPASDPNSAAEIPALQDAPEACPSTDLLPTEAEKETPTEP
ncbi:MAG: hypothetical protein ACRD7E_25775, partial [Bryobacteraceae bacterium]